MTTKQRTVLVATSATLFLASVVIERIMTIKANRQLDEMERYIQEMKRRNKELEALDSYLGDKIEVAKFWLQVTEED